MCLFTFSSEMLLELLVLLFCQVRNQVRFRFRAGRLWLHFFSFILHIPPFRVANYLETPVSCMSVSATVITVAFVFLLADPVRCPAAFCGGLEGHRFTHRFLPAGYGSLLLILGNEMVCISQRWDWLSGKYLGSNDGELTI